MILVDGLPLFIFAKFIFTIRMLCRAPYVLRPTSFSMAYILADVEMYWELHLLPYATWWSMETLAYGTFASIPFLIDSLPRSNLYTKVYCIPGWKTNGIFLI